MSDGPAPDDQLVAELAIVEPTGFVAARNARVKELRAAGERDRAAAIASLRKPSWTAWALNVLVHRDLEAVSAFLAAGDALDAALTQALGGDPDQVRDAQQEDRAALAEVVERAFAVLRDAGRSPGDQDQQRLSGTLRAAVTDPAVRDRLRRGVLLDDVEAPVFGFGFGAAPDSAVASLDAARAKRSARAAGRARSATDVPADPTPMSRGTKRSRKTGGAAAVERRAAEEAEAERAAARARLDDVRRAREQELAARSAAAEEADAALRTASAAAEEAHAALEAARAALDEAIAAIDASSGD